MVTEDVSPSDLDFIEGVGVRFTRLASQIDGLLDWLVDLIFDNFGGKQPRCCYCLSSCILKRLIAFCFILKLAQTAQET